MSRPVVQGTSRRALLLSAGGLVLAGCSVLRGPPVPQLYVLRPQVPASMGPRVNWRLAIAAPDAAASLDTPRIALTRSATTMDYFANAAWTDRVPLLLLRQLVQAFDASDRILSVDRDTSGLEADFVLQTELRNFEARYDTPAGPPQIVVNIQAKLARMPQREIAQNLNATEQVSAAANELNSIVMAFNQATGAAIAQIVNGTLAMSSPGAAG
jgi:cholesterol transport system auxiliary component